MNIRFILMILFFGTLHLHGQVRVTVTEFQNLLFHDTDNTLSKEIPEYIKGFLSDDPEIILVERQHLDKIIAEKTLSLAGITDSTNNQENGELLGADFIIAGSISNKGSVYRINATITKISNGSIETEMVLSHSEDRFLQMVEILAHNIKVKVTGKGDFKDQYILNEYPTKYFLAGTFAGTASLIFSHVAYIKKRDEYKEATDLEDFDRLYNSANRLNKSRYIIAGITLAAASGSIYCWLKNRSQRHSLVMQPRVLPYLQHNKKGEYAVGVQITF